MESEIIPGIIYTIREFKLDESTGDQKLVREHIFVGDFLDSASIKALNSGRKDPTHKDLRGFFANVEYDRSRAVQKYYSSLIEFSDTINDLYFKVREGTKTDRFYLWHPEMKKTLTHQFQYRNKFLKIDSNPFKRQSNLDRIFTAYGNVSFIDQTRHLIRQYLTKSQKVINMISEKNLLQIAKQYDDQVETKVIMNRYLPPELGDDQFPHRPYYQSNEVQCMNSILRDDNLPLSLIGEAGVGGRGDSKMVELDFTQIEQCTIHVKTKTTDVEAFINLETIFQLVPMDQTYIFTKMKRGDRSISKVSRKVQKFKNQVTKELLAEWANIEEHHRGLMYRKLKDSLGLVIYRIYDNGFIELQINWTGDKISIKEQLSEINNEIAELNKFINKINQLNYQLPDHEGKMIQLADVNFMNDPNSLTQFMYFNFKTVIDTNKQQISWNAFNYLAGSFSYYLSPIFNWRVYNFNELRRLTSGISESNIFYVRTDDNIPPDPLTAVIYSLGLIGNIDKEQTVTVDRQKELIVEFQKQIYRDEENQTEIDLQVLDERIAQLKRGNPGVLLNIKASGDRYLLNVKGAHNLFEINEINFLIERLFKFYFHIGVVYKYIKNYNCSSLNWILSMQEQYDSDREKRKGRAAAQDAIQIQEEEVEDIFDVGDLMDDSEIVIPDAPSAGEVDEFEQVGEVMIPKDLRDLAEVDEVKKEGKKAMSALDYLKEISGIFRTEYRRLGCTENFPAVISIRDFGRNYGRLSKRFQQIKSQMKKKDQDDYQKRFKKDFDSHDQSLDLHRKRVSWVAKKLDGLNKTLATEIADVFDRYNKGAQMKVPLDKNKTKYSGEYFYFCPRKWCYFCRESRLSDEIEMIKKNATCKICANKLYSMKGVKNTFIGFPDSKRHNHLNCLPCCFKNESKFKKKIDVCRVSHPIKKIIRSVKKSDPDVNHILTGDIIQIDRIGYLDGVPEGKLNDFFNGGQVVDKVRNNQSIFFKKGVNNVGVKNSFLEALTHIRFMDKEKLTPEEMRQGIVNSIDLAIFMMMNNGLIYTIFKTKDNTDQEALDEFKLYLSTEHVNEDILWHLTSFPGMITDEGFNLLIINRSMSTNNKDHKYTMLCPVGLRMEEYFNPDKLTAVMLKLENNIYYPITLVSCQVDFENVVLCTREIQDFVLFNNLRTPVIKKLLDHAKKNCNIKPNLYEKDRLDLYQTIDELDRTAFLDRKALHLIINYYNQVIYIKLKNEQGRFILLPIKSTPMPIATVSEIYNEFETIPIDVYKPPKNKELVTYKEALNMIKVISKRTKIPLKFKHFVVNYKDLVYGIKLDNGLTIIFQEIPIKMFKPKDQLPIIEEESNDVDISITQFEQKLMDQRQSYVNRTTFQKESYQRLRFEVSKIIPKRMELRDKIVEILEKPNELDIKRDKIEIIIRKLIDEISILKKPNLTGYKLPQIRSQCTTHDSCDDPHCFREKKGGVCQVLLPEELILPNDTIQENTLDRYVVLISDEILRNAIKRSELLDGKVSIYVNPSQMVYNVKSEMMINDPDYEVQINDLYARSVDYLNLLDNHYFRQESEVFTREVEKFLYYFEESWYKNTGLSKNDFVMNNRNIYDVLNEVLGVDIGEQMWNFVEKHNWKLWLNALHQIKGDEYQNIYQHSQFMEHFKYGKSTLTDVHLALISRLNNIKIIIMNRNAIGNRKFHCLGTTQASSSSKVYIILYRYDQDSIYLVGRTPHLDLTRTDDVIYVFKENKIPIKFFKMWYDHCPQDHKIQKKPDSYDVLIKDIPKSPDYESFSYDEDDEDERPDIKMEEIIEAPTGKADTIKRPEFLESLDESLIERKRSPSRSPRKRSPSPRKRSRKKISPPRKLTIKKRAPAKKTSPIKKLTIKKRAPSKKKISPPRKLTIKKRAPAKKSPPRKITLKKRSTSRAKPKLTLKKRRSRSVSRKKTRSRSRSRSTSRGRKKPARLTFKKRK